MLLGPESSIAKISCPIVDIFYTFFVLSNSFRLKLSGNVRVSVRFLSGFPPEMSKFLSDFCRGSVGFFNTYEKSRHDLNPTSILFSIPYFFWEVQVFSENLQLSTIYYKFSEKSCTCHRFLVDSFFDFCNKFLFHQTLEGIQYGSFRVFGMF